MNFGDAIKAILDGKRVTRKGNEYMRFVVMQPELKLPPYSTQAVGPKVNDRTAKWIGEDTPLNCRPYLAMYNADYGWQPGWLPSQEDIFADDWEIVA